MKLNYLNATMRKPTLKEFLDMYTWEKHADWKNAGYEVNYPNGKLVTICVYRKGAIALCALLNGYLKAVTLPPPPTELKIV